MSAVIFRTITKSRAVVNAQIFIDVVALTHCIVCGSAPRPIVANSCKKYEFIVELLPAPVAPTNSTSYGRMPIADMALFKLTKFIYQNNPQIAPTTPPIARPTTVLMSPNVPPISPPISAPLLAPSLTLSQSEICISLL